MPHIDGMATRESERGGFCHSVRFRAENARRDVSVQFRYSVQKTFSKRKRTRVQSGRNCFVLTLTSYRRMQSAELEVVRRSMKRGVYGSRDEDACGAYRM